MSEVKENPNSDNSTGLLHPVVTDRVNTNANDSDIMETPQKPLDVNAQTLHYAASSTAQQPMAEKPKVQFDSATGSKTAQRINPFAEQNAKLAEKKKAKTQKRKKGIIIGIVCGCIVLIAAIVIVIIILNSGPKIEYTPEITGSSEEDILDYRNLLQQFYNQQKAENESNDNSEEDHNLVSNINQVVQNTLNTSIGKENANAVLNARVYFYYNNGYYQEVINLLPQIDMDMLDNNLKANIYEVAANSYASLGDMENANAYYKLLFITPVEGPTGYGG